MATKKKSEIISREELEVAFNSVRRVQAETHNSMQNLTLENTRRILDNMQECTNRLMFVLNKTLALVAEPKIPAPIDNLLHVDCQPTPIMVDNKLVIKIIAMSSALTAVCTGAIVAIIMGLLG